jgi:NADH-quinone oxidoreductase subunit F
MTLSNTHSLQLFLGEHSHKGRSALLPALHYAQKAYGFISAGTAAEIGRSLGVPLADVYGVIDFYSLLTTQPVGPSLKVCADPICALAGGEHILSGGLQQQGYQVERVSCLGLCNHAPALLANDIFPLRGSPKRMEALYFEEHELLEDYIGGPLQLLTARCRQPGSADLADYRSNGGYQALAKALSLPPAEIIAEVKASGLLGRGGAAFPAGTKWEAVQAAPGPVKYVVCNADEAEPGSFKDRILLEKDPHRTLEGMLIAAFAVGAQYGYIYIRGEYPRALAALEKAVEEAHLAGLLGENILGSPFHFDLEIRQGGGAYICGEETALFESIEGKRGFPRVKPPFPTTHGLFGMPTLINNVETLCNVPLILARGADEYRRTGTTRSTGPKLFCVSGDVVQPGLYEVPFGISLRELIYDLAGGISGGAGLGAILLGGAAGSFAVEADLDVPLSFEHLRAAGLSLGSGAVMVFDDRRDLRWVLKRIAHFFADESCGKCYPCQIGTQRQYEILGRVAVGQTLPGDFQRLEDVGWTMTDASLCGLGQTAALAVLSALKRFPHLFENGHPRTPLEKDGE